MNYTTSVKGWIRRQITSKRSALQREIQEQADRRNSEFEAHLNAAKGFRSRKNHQDAIVRFRRALRVDPNRPQTWIDYGHSALALSWTSLAHEAFQNALEIDPTNIRALEIYIDTAAALKMPRRRTKQIVRTAMLSGPNDPQTVLNLLDFAIPLGLAPKSTDARSPATSKADALIALNTFGEDSLNAVARDMDESTRRDLLIRLYLLRGRYTAAEKLLAKTRIDSYPIDTMRRTMKRLDYQNRHQPAKMLASRLIKAKPDDRLAKARWDHAEAAYRTSAAGVEKQSLLRSGFPFPPRSESRFSNERSALYLLHNSLPFSSAGYATRSHGLISNISKLGFPIAGVTRPGYPFDRPEAAVEEIAIPAYSMVGGIKYHHLSTEPERLAKSPLVPYIHEYSQRLEQLTREQYTGLIHAASNHWNGLAAVFTANKLGIPSIYEVRGLWEVTRISREPEWNNSLDYTFMAGMEAEAAKAATHVLAITSALKNELISRGVDGAKIDVIPNGVDTRRFTPKPQDTSLKESLGLTGKTVIGYVGSILDYEGIDTLIDSAAILKSTANNFHFLIVGDGSYLDNAVSRARAMGVEDVVSFVGRVPHEEVEQYYSIIDIAPIPRHSLPVTEMVSPLKPFEAMAMGKVVVGSNVEAIEEIIVPGVNGLVFQKDDASDLAKVLATLTEDKDSLSALGRSSRDWVVSERDWAKLAQQVVSIYDKLL